MSTTAHQTRRPGRRSGPARAARVLLAGFVGLLAIVLGGSPASAYWSSTGTGAAAGQTGTLAAPVVSVPANAVTDVSVNWTAGTGGVTPDGYYVTRQLGPTTAPACASSPTALITVTSCSDRGVADGSYTYVVTAVFRSWTAPSASSSTVTVVNPTRLDFSPEPSDTVAGAVTTSPVVVRLLSASGDPVGRSGVPVTLAIGANPAFGSLSGTTAVSTVADGTATFDDLSIDRAGDPYTLVATSPGLTPAASDDFTVLPRPPLGDARSYSVLGGTGVVNTLGTSVSGDLGIGDGSGVTVTGFGPGTVGGDVHRGDADAVDALDAAAGAYSTMWDLAAESEDELVGELGGTVLLPGVYHAGAALSITGTLTLDAQNDPDAVFIIRVNAALDQAAASHVVLDKGARAANVYWVTNGAVTLGANSHFEGTVLARGAITIGDSTVLIGRAFATGTVTMADNVVRFTTALPPTLTISAQAVEDTKDVTPTISGTTSAPTGTAIKVTVGGQTLTATVRAGGGWSVTAASLLARSYVVTAQVRDAAGNATRASRTFVVEVNPDLVDLGSAASYSVLAGDGGVSNTGATHATGDVGTTGVVVGFSPSMTDGTIHHQDAAALAQADLQGTITDARGRTAHTEFAGDLGGRTFHTGVHRSDAAVGLTGAVTLDGEGDANARFIFQIRGALTGAADCQVNLVGEAQAKNVFWIVDGAAGTGASCAFAGTVMATGAITLGDGTDLEGRALSRAAVTLASNTLTGVSPAPHARSAAPEPSPENTPTAVSSTPTPTPSPTSTPSPTPGEPMPSSETRSPEPPTTPAPTPSVSLDPIGAT